MGCSVDVCGFRLGLFRSLFLLVGVVFCVCWVIWCWVFVVSVEFGLCWFVDCGFAWFVDSICLMLYGVFGCIGLVVLVWSCFLVAGLWFGVSVSRVSGGLVVLVVLLLV